VLLPAQRSLHAGVLRAQAQDVVRIGGLLPLTSIGAPYGPTMALIHKGVVDQVNAAGGVNGQNVEYAYEDDQVNPDAGVLAARKLIDINKVGVIIGAWSSSVAHRCCRSAGKQGHPDRLRFSGQSR